MSFARARNGLLLAFAVVLLTATLSASAHPAAQTGQLLVFPIVAEAGPPVTVYMAEFANPEGLELSYEWSGPNCGELLGTSGKTSDTNGRFEFAWSHHHPPCDATTDHS